MNPYNSALPAPAEVFVGRNGLMRQYLEGLSNHLAYWLAGEHGMGKTSVLFAQRRTITARSNASRVGSIPIPVYLDCTREIMPLEPMLLGIIDGVMSALREIRRVSFTPQQEEQARRDAGRQRLDAALALLLDQAYSQEKQTHSIVLLVDNMQRLGKDSWQSLASILQTILNHRRQDLALLLASRDPMPPEFERPSPLVALTKHDVLGPLDRRDTAALVNRAEEAGWKVEQGCGDLAFELTGGHPYRLHYYLHAALVSERRLTLKGLTAADSIETRTYLSGVLRASETRTPQVRPLVFISYCHKDEQEKVALMNHMGVLGSADLIEAWSDDRIGAGADWEKRIEAAIQGARLAILLISANFLTSEFILRKEVPALRQRRDQQGLDIFPLIAKPCAWQKVEWLARMNVRPTDNKAVWRDKGAYADEELAKFANEVANALRIR